MNMYHNSSEFNLHANLLSLKLKIINCDSDLADQEF
jgi:hypothetical protein